MPSVTITGIRVTNGGPAAGRPLEAGFSPGLLSGEVTCEQARYGVFRLGEFLPATPQAGLEAGQFSLHARAVRRIGVLADVCASCWPYFDQSLGGQQPDSGLRGVLRDVMSIPKLPVRRQPCTWRVRSASDLGPEDIRETPARVPVRAWQGHKASVATCLKTALDGAATPSYCLESEMSDSRQYEAEGSSTASDNSRRRTTWLI
jgi:hypothetical protein